MAGLTRQLAAEAPKLDTAQAAVQAAAERMQALQGKHAQERKAHEGQLREVQEQLWEAQEQVVGLSLHASHGQMKAARQPSCSRKPS